MEAALRTRIRQALDQQARTRRQTVITERALPVCYGCGCDAELYTKGCPRCYDRRRRGAKARA